MKKITLILLFLFGMLTAFSQTLVINEVMTSNLSVIADDDGEYNDWIEIYYNGAAAINLEGYALSDDSTLPAKWVFPQYWMEPGEHLLIWCSDKNRTDINNDFHTNFKISSTGEVLYFNKPNGTLQDSFPAVILPADVSYGRQTDGAVTKVYFQQSTPGSANNTPSFSQVLNAPNINIPSGFSTSSFSVNVTYPDPSVTIVYTLDGSDPIQTNLGGTNYNYKNKYKELVGQTAGALIQNNYKSFTYTAPITITDRSSIANDLAKMSSTFQNVPNYIPTFNVFKGTVLKVRAFKNGAIPSPIVTKSYFVTPQGSARFTLPVVSLSITESKFFDYTNGIFVAGKDFDDWRALNPSVDADFNTINEDAQNANYYRIGDNEEQKGHISYFVNGLEVLNQDIGIELNGGNSRGFQSKALRLVARSEYGNDKMSYPFFANETHNSYKRLLLRNSGQDFRSTMFRDGLFHTLVEKLNTETKSYQPSIVFVNGEYWGILNIRERYDRYFFEQKYNIAKGELDYLKNDLTPAEGDGVHYAAMETYLQNNSLLTPANYNYIKTQLDPENFRDYYISNIYAQSTDWPGWNTIFWRKRTVAYEPTAPFGQDGRWRTGINDMDDTMGEYPEGSNHNTLEFATATGVFEYPNPEWSTLILRRLLENNEFKLNFINRFADVLNTFFLPSRVNATIEAFKNRLTPEIPEHQARWKPFYDVDTWNDYSIQRIRDFANGRPNNQRAHIRAKFGIAGDINANLNVDDVAHGFIKMNTVEINDSTPGVAANPYPWTGIYFMDVPVTMKAVALPGFTFSHWSGDSNSMNAEITLTRVTDFSVTAHFVPAGSGGEEVPIYFWMFNSTIANNTPLTSLNSTYQVPAQGVLTYQSCLSGYPFDATNPNWRKASMERKNSPTTINYIPEVNDNLPFASSNMKGMQIKQPFQNNGQENKIIFSNSTLGYHDIKFSFAAQNELAADALVIDYSVASGAGTWITTGLTATSFPLTAAYQQYTIDFSAIAAVNNNANFKIRVRFTGADMTTDLGNNVNFNNFSIKGKQDNLGVVQPDEKLEFSMYPNPTSSILNLVYSYQDVTFAIYSIDGKLIRSGNLENPQINVSNIQHGIYLLQLSAEGKSETKKFIKN
ncbi:CotH kinase family protein [Flavobacterium sp.]